MLIGLCIGSLIIFLSVLIIYAVHTGGARKNFSELAQRVEEETVSLPAEQAPDAYAELKTQNPDFMGWIKLDGTTVNYRWCRQKPSQSIICAAALKAAIPSPVLLFWTRAAIWKTARGSLSTATT